MKKLVRLSAGFTLIEVVVALTILSLSVVTLMTAISTGLTQSRINQAETIAAAHAQSLLSELGRSKPLNPGTTSGRFSDGFRWRMNIERFTPISGGTSGGLKSARVELIVSWGDAGKKRHLSLKTLQIEHDGE